MKSPIKNIDDSCLKGMFLFNFTFAGDPCLNTGPIFLLLQLLIQRVLRFCTWAVTCLADGREPHVEGSCLPFPAGAIQKRLFILIFKLTCCGSVDPILPDVVLVFVPPPQKTKGKEA